MSIPCCQVFLKSGVISRLEKQRDKLIAQKMILLQAACKGFLSRQKFKRLKIQRLAIRCIQKNLVVFQAIRHWPWWQLLSHVRPLLSVNLTEEQLRAKEVCSKGWDGMDGMGWTGWDGWDGM